jgi:hypothetical protein
MRRLVVQSNDADDYGYCGDYQYAEEDQAAGTIYVLRSKSENPVVAANRDLIHKIGVTSMNVDQRIAGARLQPTFLMADVEVVATYELLTSVVRS